MERPLSMFERALYVDGETPVAIVLAATLRGRIDEVRLRRALGRLQAKHPLLRCLVRSGGGRPRFFGQEPPPPVPLRILGRESEDDWLREAQAERRRPLDAVRGPLMRVTWLRGAAASDLLLIVHHCLCDGLAVAALLRDLLRLCERPDADIGGYVGLPDPIAWLPDEVLRDHGLRRSIRVRAALFRAGIRLCRPGAPRRYGEQYLFQWTLGTAVTAALRERCRQASVTLSAGLVAAFQLAFLDVAGPRGLDRIAVAVNPRRYLKKLPADAFFAMAPTVKFSGRRLASREVWTQARALGSVLDHGFLRAASDLFRNMLVLEHLHGVFDRLLGFSRSLRGGRNLIFSNLGQLDLAADYGEFRLEAVHAHMAMLSPTTAHLLACTGYGGKLEFCFMSDDISLPRAKADAIRQRAMALLVEGLAVGDAPEESGSAIAGPIDRSLARPV